MLVQILVGSQACAGAGARADLLLSGASRGEARDGFQQIIKFSPHNDTGAITTWTPAQSRYQFVCCTTF